MLRPLFHLGHQALRLLLRGEDAEAQPRGVGRMAGGRVDHHQDAVELFQLGRQGDGQHRHLCRWCRDLLDMVQKVLSRRLGRGRRCGASVLAGFTARHSRQCREHEPYMMTFYMENRTLKETGRKLIYIYIHTVYYVYNDNTKKYT